MNGLPAAGVELEAGALAEDVGEVTLEVVVEPPLLPPPPEPLPGRHWE
jgi:hypothetical protein